MNECFSVLIAVYFREKGDCLRQALESVFNQTIPPAEVELVKDGPMTQELEAVLSDFATQYAAVMKVVALEKNVGLGEALNQGLKHCTNELVARMDSDDICVPDRFEQQLKAFESDPELSVVGGWIDEFSTDPAVIDGSRKLPEMHEQIAHFAKSKNPSNHVTVMFRKQNVESVGGYQTFYLMEDYWLWVRMLKAQFKFRNIPKTLVLVRGGTAMAARRGGWKYARTEARLFGQMRQMGLIDYTTYIKNISVRFIVRMMPNRMRSWVYQTLLRK